MENILSCPEYEQILSVSFWPCRYDYLYTVGPFWDIVGNSLITNEYTRLTADAQSQRGGLWNIQVS